MELQEKRRRIYEWIDRNITVDSKPAEAARYVVLGNGHLWRSLVTIGAAEIYGAELEKTIPVAVAQELIHSATLVLDDLPSMDDSKKRRDRDSCWYKFGVASAELASHYLIAESILCATRSGLTAEQVRAILDENAVTAKKLIAGQDRDLRQVDVNGIEQIVDGLYALKSGALFGSAAATGGIVGGAEGEDITRLRAFGHYLGIAYQLGDDLCDAYADEMKLGKPTGKDRGKRTALTILGPEKTIEMKKTFEEKALDQLRMIQRNGIPLERIVREIGDLRLRLDSDATTV